MDAEDRARLDEHGRQLNLQSERLNVHAQRLDGLVRVVLGDKNEQVIGLAQRTTDLETLVEALDQWRRETFFVAKVVIALLGITSVGTWIPIVKAILAAWGI